jgi:DNA-binding XRE family transcriptional regulator
MNDKTTFNSVQHLRKILQKTQEEFAVLAGVSRDTIASIETSRLRLSSTLANRISKETGVAIVWLTANDSSLAMVNFNGRPYAYSDFRTAQDKRLEPLKSYRDEPEMEICVAYILLRRALQAAKKRNEVPQFRHRLERIIRSEIHQFGELRDEIYSELREWNERYVGTGRTFPKSLLFPRDAASFEQGRQEFEQAVKWVADWEKQIPPRRPKPRKITRRTA